MAHRGTQAALPPIPGELMRSNLPQTGIAAFLGGFMSLVINRTAVLPAIALASLAATIIVVCLALVELRADDKHADIDQLVRHQRKVKAGEDVKAGQLVTIDSDGQARPAIRMHRDP